MAKREVTQRALWLVDLMQRCRVSPLLCLYASIPPPADTTSV